MSVKYAVQELSPWNGVMRILREVMTAAAPVPFGFGVWSLDSDLLTTMSGERSAS